MTIEQEELIIKKLVKLAEGYKGEELTISLKISNSDELMMIGNIKYHMSSFNPIYMVLMKLADVINMKGVQVLKLDIKSKES